MRGLRNQGSDSDDEDTWKWKETSNRAVDLLFLGDEPGPKNQAIGVTEPYDSCYLNIFMISFWLKLIIMPLNKGR